MLCILPRSHVRSEPRVTRRELDPERLWTEVELHRKPVEAPNLLRFLLCRNEVRLPEDLNFLSIFNSSHTDGFSEFPLKSVSWLLVRIKDGSANTLNIILFVSKHFTLVESVLGVFAGRVVGHRSLAVRFRKSLTNEQISDAVHWTCIRKDIRLFLSRIFDHKSTQTRINPV